MTLNSTSYKYFLWSLKLGAILNIYFLLQTFETKISSVDPFLLIPAQILFFVSAYRCLFPVGYVKNIVLHDTIFSSIFLTRKLATFVEIAYIYMFSYVLRIANTGEFFFLDLLSWLMVIQVIVSQGFVWGAILFQREKYYYFEEFGWAIIFALNTFISFVIFLYGNNYEQYKILIQLNLIFGCFYLPWQFIHLRSISKRVAKNYAANSSIPDISMKLLVDGLNKSFFYREQTSKPDAWGGFVGLTWMLNYWATLIPVWLYFIIYRFASN